MFSCEFCEVCENISKGASFYKTLMQRKEPVDLHVN